METDSCRVGDDCRNNNRTTQVLLEFSSCLPREEICDLQFAPSIQPDTVFCVYHQDTTLVPRLWRAGSDAASGT